MASGRKSKKSRRSRGQSRAAQIAQASLPSPRVDPKVMLVSVLLLFVAAATASIFTVPQFLAFSNASSQLSDRQAEVVDLERRLAAATLVGDADLEGLYIQVQLLEEAFPVSPSREQITVQLVQVADAFGVKVEKLDPAGDPPGEDLASFRFAARFSGSYGALVNMLEAFDTLGPVVTLRAAQLSSQNEAFIVTATIDVWYVKFGRLTEPDGSAAPPQLDLGVADPFEPAEGEQVEGGQVGVTDGPASDPVAPEEAADQGTSSQSETDAGSSATGLGTSNS